MDDDDWQVKGSKKGKGVSPEWVLRDIDWDAKVVTYSEMGEAIDAVGVGRLRVVVQTAPEEEAEAAEAMVSSLPTSAVTIVWRDSAAELRLPGDDNGKVVPSDVRCEGSRRGVDLRRRPSRWTSPPWPPRSRSARRR